jgi:predicted component of type VI protein secretion system
MIFAAMAKSGGLRQTQGAPSFIRARNVAHFHCAPRRSQRSMSQRFEERNADACDARIALAIACAPPDSSQDASATLVLATSAGEAHPSDEGAEFAPARVAGESSTADESASATSMAAGAAMAAIESLQFSAATRKEAIFLLDEVVRYLRVAEPSSPIPWLIERAKALADRDFISVLASVLPDDALRSPGSGR